VSIGLLLLAIERRSRLQGSRAFARVSALLLVANDRTEASVDDWTEEPIDNQGKQGIAIGRTSRSAIKGRGLDGSRAFSAATDRTDASVGFLSATTRSNGRSSAVATTTDRGGSTAVDRF
jgi:hypothetical protein